MLFQKIKDQLIKEIEALTDKRGFIKAGLPRFDRLFGRDSLIVSWQLLDWNPGVCRATLGILSDLQGREINNEREEEPGKIIHETDLKQKTHALGYFPFPYYGSVDSTPLFLIVFYFYFQKTQDIKFLRKYWKNILMALEWMEKYGDKDKDGFLEYQRKNPQGLFHQGWKDNFVNHLAITPPVAIVEVQGYQYLALKGVAELAGVVEKRSLAENLSERAENLKIKFNKEFWVQENNFFALGLDKDKKQKKAITSNPGHLLFTGILDKNREGKVVEKLFSPELWTPFGIRTHSIREKDFDPLSYHLGSIWPHDNWIIAQGLKKLGYQKEYEKTKKALFSAYQEMGFLPELYGVVNNKIKFKEVQFCHPQAWASGALLNFISDSFKI